MTNPTDHQIRRGRRRPGELLFELYAERDHTRWLCELCQHPEPYNARGPDAA